MTTTSQTSQTPQPASEAAASEAPKTTWPHRHVLDLDNFTAEEIVLTLDLADRMREVLDRRIARVPALRGFTVVNLFYEPSTRTRASF